MKSFFKALGTWLGNLFSIHEGKASFLVIVAFAFCILGIWQVRTLGKIEDSVIKTIWYLV